MTAPTAGLPAWDPRVGWDEQAEGRPAPDCAHGSWNEASRWNPMHGQPDDSGYLVPPPGTRCLGCGTELAPHKELLDHGCGGCGDDAWHYHCGNCAAYLDDEDEAP